LEDFADEKTRNFLQLFPNIGYVSIRKESDTIDNTFSKNTYQVNRQHELTI